MAEEYVILDKLGSIQKKLTRGEKMLILGMLLVSFILGIILGRILFGAAFVPTATKVYIRAAPEVGTFPSDLRITVQLLDSNLYPRATVVLESPTWTATVENLNLKEYFYVLPIVDGWYWVYYKTTTNITKLQQGIAGVVKVTGQEVMVDLYFVRKANVTFGALPNITTLADGIETTVTVDLQFNITPYSGIYGLILEFELNSTELNFTKVEFDGVEYEVVNGTVEIMQFIINDNDTVKTETLKLTFVENLSSPVSIKLTVKTLDEKHEEEVLAVIETVWS